MLLDYLIQPPINTCVLSSLFLFPSRSNIPQTPSFELLTHSSSVLLSPFSLSPIFLLQIHQLKLTSCSTHALLIFINTHANSYSVSPQIKNKNRNEMYRTTLSLSFCRVKKKAKAKPDDPFVLLTSKRGN